MKVISNRKQVNKRTREKDYKEQRLHMKETSNTKQDKCNIRNKAFNKYQAVLKIRHMKIH